MKSETKELARALAIELAAIADMPKCEWISEEKALEEFPFSKDQLRRLRDNSELEYKHHWKNAGVRKSQMGAGRSPMRLYHRQRMIDYVNSI